MRNRFAARSRAAGMRFGVRRGVGSQLAEMVVVFMFVTAGIIVTLLAFLGVGVAR